MARTAIPNAVTVITQILLYSSRSSIPTLTWKMQLASMWSISCNIQHLTHQHCQYKIHWSMLRKRTFCHYRLTNMGNQRSAPHNNIIKQMMARAGSMANWSEPLEYRPACDPNAACASETTWNTLLKQQKEREMNWGFCRQRDHCGNRGS